MQADSLPSEPPNSLQRPHLLRPLHWEMGFQHMDLRGTHLTHNREARFTPKQYLRQVYVIFMCLFPTTRFISVQFSSVAQSCPTLCDPMNPSTPGLPVRHQLPEFTQTHVHRVNDAIQPSHPLSITLNRYVNAHVIPEEREKIYRRQHGPCVERPRMPAIGPAAGPRPTHAATCVCQA